MDKELDYHFETVSVEKKEYERLKDNAKFLQALQNAGVDNWEGYDFAIELYGEEGS